MSNRSNFPTQIDTFAELYDLPPSKIIQAKRYQELKAKVSLTSLEQQELNQLTLDLADYIISPEVWNKVCDAIVNLETFFRDNVQGYIGTKQAEWATYVNNFKLIGVYDNTKSYKFQNMVTHNGDLYLATKDVPAGTVPTNTSYWQKASAKGEKGDTGLNAYYKGSYDNTRAYVVGEAVSYNGNMYYAKVATTGVAPTDSSKWFLWDRTIVSASTPSAPQQGLLWIKLQ